MFFNAVPWTLFAYGEHRTSSIVAGLWNATTPLWVLLFSLAAFARNVRPADRLTGLGLGFLGVATLLGPWRGLGGGALIGHLAMRRRGGLLRPRASPTRGATWRAAPRAASCCPPASCLRHRDARRVPAARPGAPTLHIGLDGAGSLLALGALGSGVAFAINYSIVRAKGIALASTVTYLIPVFSTALGAIVLGETLHWNQPAGTAVLLGGIAISQGRLARRRPALTPSRQAAGR